MVSNGQIKIAIQDGRYRLYHDPPLFLNVIENGDGLLLMPADQGGGVLPGDTQKIRLELSGRVRVTWAPASATVVFSPTEVAGENDEVVLSTEIVIGEDSELIFLSPNLIPGKNTNIKQVNSIRANQSSSFIYCETNTAGRIAHGEKWAYYRLKNELRLVIDNKTLYQERYALNSGKGYDSKSGFMGDKAWSTIICQHGHAEEIIDRYCAFMNNLGTRTGYSMIRNNLCIAKVLESEGVFLNKNREYFMKQPLLNYHKQAS